MVMRMVRVMMGVRMVMMMDLVRGLVHGLMRCRRGRRVWGSRLRVRRVYVIAVLRPWPAMWCSVFLGWARVVSRHWRQGKWDKLQLCAAFFFCSGSRVGGVDGTRSQDQKKAGKMPKKKLEIVFFKLAPKYIVKLRKERGGGGRRGCYVLLSFFPSWWWIVEIVKVFEAVRFLLAAWMQ